MTLIKKTIVLTEGGGARGFATIVRVGRETGVKVVGDDIRKGDKLFIRVDKNTQIITLDGKRTESALKLSIENNSDVSCVIISDGRIIAKGGKELRPSELNRILSEEKAGQQPVAATANSLDTEPEKTISEPETTENSVNEESEPDENETGVTDDGGASENIDNEEQREFIERLSQEKSGYYIGIQDKVDELFVVYPSEEKLTATIPDSEWVRINYDNEDYYVVGRLKENGKVAYVGYGVPGKEAIKPPKVAEGIANFLPISGLDNGYDGYWLFFQDADTGKIS